MVRLILKLNIQNGQPYIYLLYQYVWENPSDLILYEPVNSFFSHIGKFTWIKLVLSSEDKVSCSSTQHSASCEA